MNRIIVIVTGLTLWAFADIPNTPGWYSIPNTKMRYVCEDGDNTCSGVFAWSGGVFDTKRNRLIIWGGGHGDYSGNEVYALNLDGTPNFVRLNNSTAGGCSMESCDGGATPNSRHTYDGIVYMPNVDRMFVHGGSMAGVGWCQSNCEPNTWLLDFTNLTWRGSTPSGLNPGQGSYNIMMTDFDPNTGKVFTRAMASNDGYLYAYTFSTDTYERLGSNSSTTGYWGCGVIDPKRKKFVTLGGGESSIYDISGSGSYNRQAFTTTGGDFIKSSGYPGLVYDPVRDRIVAWNGGDSVFSLNMDTRVWTKVTYPGGPGARNGTGTYKRWNYVPALDAFVLVNSITQNAFTFRFPGSGTGLQKPRTIGTALAMSVSPNPAGRGTPVELRLAGAAQGRVTVADAAGRTLMAAAVSGRIQWDHRAVAPGIYFARWSVGGKTLAEKRVIVLD